MGAWGEGLQANDKALDTIDSYETELAKIVHDRDPARAAIVLDQIHANLDNESTAWGVLGAAEHLLDACGPEILEQCKPVLEQALDTELATSQLELWSDSEGRRKAVELFRCRLNGEQVDTREVEQTNEGLMSRIVRDMSGLSYDDAYGPDGVEGDEEDPPK